MIRAAAVCMLLLWFLSSPTQASSAPHAAAASGSTVSGNTAPAPGDIALDVVVTDGAGKPVSGLTRADFAVTDNKQGQPVLTFKAVTGAPRTDAPQQTVFVIDEVNTAFTDVGRARGELSGFLRRNGGNLPVPASILLLTDKGVTMSGAPTRDGNVLAGDLDAAASRLRTTRRSQGFYGAVDRLKLSIQALTSLTTYERQQPGKKLVIWIGPGWPYLAAPGTTFNADASRNQFALVTSLSTGLREADMVLYSVDPRGMDDAVGFQTTYYRGFLKGVAKESKTSLSNLGLQVLAYQSGGLVLNSSNNIAGELGTCLQDTASYYVLTIASAAPERGVDYHELAVQIRNPGLSARTRAGYYAQAQ